MNTAGFPTVRARPSFLPSSGTDARHDLEQLVWVSLSSESGNFRLGEGVLGFRTPFLFEAHARASFAFERLSV